MDYKIRHVMDHVAVYDKNGRFLFSADHEAEALREIGEMLKEQYISNKIKK